MTMRTRRHHNNKGERQIRSGKTYRQVRRIVAQILRDKDRSKRVMVAAGKALTQR